jgi:hypothetical protein
MMVPKKMRCHKVMRVRAQKTWCQMLAVRAMVVRALADRSLTE